MINYEWPIKTLEYNVEDGGVIVAHWRCIAEDGDYTASAYGSASFTPDPTSPDFIPYADLTEEDVLSWVWISVDKDEVEVRLAAQIEDMKSPQTITGVPW